MIDKPLAAGAPADGAPLVQLKKTVEHLNQAEGVKADPPWPPCRGCGGPYPTDTVVPSVRWNAVIRAHGIAEWLCTPCIIREFVTRGESFTADIDGVPFEVRVNNQIARDATDISEENTTLRMRIRELEAPADGAGPQEK